MKAKKKENSVPFSHPRWKEIPTVEVVGESEVTKEEEKLVDDYIKKSKLETKH